jgi:hypothetical protein
VKNNNGNQRSVSDFDLHLEIKYGGRSKTKLYTQNVMNLLLVGFVLFIFFTLSCCVFCYVFCFVLLLLVRCLMFNMLRATLDCPFSIQFSLLSKVYLQLMY